MYLKCGTAIIIHTADWYCCIEYCVIKVDADMLYCHVEFRLEYQIDSLQYFMYSFAYKFIFKASFETLNLPKTTKATN